MDAGQFLGKLTDMSPVSCSDCQGNSKHCRVSISRCHSAAGDRPGREITVVPAPHPCRSFFICSSGVGGSNCFGRGTCPTDNRPDRPIRNLLQSKLMARLYGERRYPVAVRQVSQRVPGVVTCRRE
jgi:hypothetical protein